MTSHLDNKTRPTTNHNILPSAPHPTPRPATPAPAAPTPPRAASLDHVSSTTHRRSAPPPAVRRPSSCPTLPLPLLLQCGR